MKYVFAYIIILMCFPLSSQVVNSICTTRSNQWVKGESYRFKKDIIKPDIIIDIADIKQRIDGFGACFNELGWEALLSLSKIKRTTILEELFSEDGVNFTLCRLPLGSNDYSLSYYSFNDVPEDIEMKNFNIDRDRYILIPYIKAAQKINPKLRFWASPWSPPAWMKVNNHYAMGANTNVKKMDEGKVILNNATAFRMEDAYLNAYALYFSKFVQAYKKEGIDISCVMVQNEPVYQPHWQSCTWRPEDLAFFIGKYLGPRFNADSLNTDIWLGTVNSNDPNYARSILKDNEAQKYIKGAGFQWDAKYTIETLNNEFGNLPMMQTESECGNGENSWSSAEYTWSLINRYLINGVNSYMYWNMVLDNSGKSTWGWRQNMMISIDKESGEVVYNPEFYLMKHLSHFVVPGSYRLNTHGKEYLAFLTPTKQVQLLYFNADDADKTITVEANNQNVTLTIKKNSINTFYWGSPTLK